MVWVQLFNNEKMASDLPLLCDKMVRSSDLADVWKHFVLYGNCFRPLRALSAL